MNWRVKQEPIWKGLSFPPQIKLGGSVFSEDRENIKDSILHILTTPLGSRVMRPDFGCILPELIDRPLTQSTLAQIMTGVIEAISFWEPRVSVKKVNCYIPLERPYEVIVEIFIVEKLTGVEETIRFIYDREAKRWAR